MVTGLLTAQNDGSSNLIYLCNNLNVALFSTILGETGYMQILPEQGLTPDGRPVMLGSGAQFLLIRLAYYVRAVPKTLQRRTRPLPQVGISSCDPGEQLPLSSLKRSHLHFEWGWVREWRGG